AAELCAQKCGCQLGNQFFGGVCFRAKAGSEFAVEPILMTCKVSKLMEYGRVITTHVLERGHGWHLYLILCRDIECPVTADANICQCCRDKGTRRVLGYDCFGHFFFREFLALRHVDDGK